MCDNSPCHRERHAHTQRDHDGIRFGVVAVLKRVIPAVEHLDDGSTEADGHDSEDGEAAQSHRKGSVTPPRFIELGMSVTPMARPARRGPPIVGQAARCPH
jgi:hypothetical protein